MNRKMMIPVKTKRRAGNGMLKRRINALVGFSDELLATTTSDMTASENDPTDKPDQRVASPPEHRETLPLPRCCGI